MNRAFLLALALLFAFDHAAGRAVQEQAAPHIGVMHVQTLPPFYYFHTGFETDFKSMTEPLRKAIPALFKAAGEGKVPIRGPVMHLYYDSPHLQPDKRFKMETGVAVSEDSKPAGAFKVRQTARFKCATILYTGPGKRIGDAWQRLAQAVRAAGLEPTGEERELYLYWEAEDSPNNIVQAQLGVR